jgi:hypothetical protein
MIFPGHLHIEYVIPVKAELKRKPFSPAKSMPE